jgi:hypothetical protein
MRRFLCGPCGIKESGGLVLPRTSFNSSEDNGAKWTANNELETTLKEMVIAELGVLSLHFPGRAEEKREKLQSG